MFQCSQKPLKLFYKCLCVCHLKRLIYVAVQLKEDENLRMEKREARGRKAGTGLAGLAGVLCLSAILNFIMTAFRDDLPNQTG